MLYTKKIFFVFAFFSLLITFVNAEEIIDEDALFSMDNTVVDISEVSVATNTVENSTTFSGEIEYLNIQNTQADKTVTSNYMLGNFFLDVRKQKGVKAFANLQALNDSENNTTVSLKEFFMDFNSKNKIYFRAGKQVLQWGRCYLWNPTDFVNVEKNTFIERIGYRQGSSGIKMHIPSGTKYNFYSFVNFADADSMSDQGFANKFEFLVDNTEMAFSIFNKNGYNPAYGYDFSTRIFKIDAYGEVATSYGDNAYQVRLDNGKLIKYRNDNEWVTKASLGFNKNFDSPNFNDRYSVRTEFFYNSNGYDDNIFQDKTIYNYAQSVVTTDDNGNIVTKTTGTKYEFIDENNIYDPNYHSKYYGALFITMSRFILTDMSLNMNFINNLVDKSFITSLGVTYTDLNDFSLGFTVNIYGGNSDCEYTIENNQMMTQFTVSLGF